MPSVETTMARRRETPGAQNWARSAHPDSPNKYFMVSSDCHANEPKDWVKSRIEPEYLERLPRLEMKDGQAFIITEGNRPWKIKTDTTDWGPEDIERNKTGCNVAERIVDQNRDGIDLEVVFGNKGIHAFGTNDPGFSMAMCKCWNDWAHEEFGAHQDRILPMAQIPTLDVKAAIKEVERVAKLGFRDITIPVKPEYGPTGMDQRNYNQLEFEPLWAAIADADLPLTIHVSTGRDPRAASGPGGADLETKIALREQAIEDRLRECETPQQFSELMDTIDIPWGQVRDPHDLEAQATLKHRGMIVQIDDRAGGTRQVADSPYRFSQAKSGVRGPAAHRGEHNRSVMKDWLGLTDAQIDARVDSTGVIPYERS